MLSAIGDLTLIELRKVSLRKHCYKAGHSFTAAVQTDSRLLALALQSAFIACDGLVSRSVPMRRVDGHRVAIHESSGVEHAEAVAFESGLLRGRVPRYSEEVEDGFGGFHGWMKQG